MATKNWLRQLAARLELDLPAAAFYFHQGRGNAGVEDWLALDNEEIAALVAGAQKAAEDIPDPDQEATARVVDMVNRLGEALGA